jgi:hypothetical protein
VVAENAGHILVGRIDSQEEVGSVPASSFRFTEIDGKAFHAASNELPR